METLKLEKFADAKLENLQTIAGGGCYTTLDGQERGDCVTNDRQFLIDTDGDGEYDAVGNPDVLPC